MDEKRFGQKIALFRKEEGLTQEELANQLHVSAQAVSKWENGHSLPETALLPQLARLLNIGIDEMFSVNRLIILEALFGDGVDNVNVTKRLNRLVENDTLPIAASPSLLGASAIENRVAFLTVKYETLHGICHSVLLEGEAMHLCSEDKPRVLPETGLEIIAGCYGTKAHHYDVMHKIEHYRPFHWNAYHANHEIFPSDPANDDTEYLTLVYLNQQGIHIATCAEGESLVYQNDKTELARQIKGKECFLNNVPVLPPFGQGMECSWAAALTVALQTMGMKATYEDVMGVSGACYRIAFCSPGWDYSSVDGLVAYDYATPGFAAYGYTPQQYAHIQKSDRAEHRARIMKEIQNNMPVLGINLRVAPEWGVICGYAKDGEDLFCRTKYDQPTLDNDPEFMKGRPPFIKNLAIPDDYLYVDHWPFLLCYFNEKRKPPSAKDNLIASLQVFVDSVAKQSEGGYYMGFKAYEVWAADLRDEPFYQACGDEQLIRRFSVNQFCALSLLDARRAAYTYLCGCAGLLSGGDIALQKIAEIMHEIARKAESVYTLLGSNKEVDVAQCRAFWTAEKRLAQATLLDEIAEFEHTAHGHAKQLLLQYS